MRSSPLSLSLYIYIHVYIHYVCVHVDHSIKENRFFYKCNFCVVWNFIYSSNHSNIAKIFVLRLFKMVANQTQRFRLKKRSIINCLVAEKCKPCEIYSIMCHVYGGQCFNQQMFTNGLITSLPRLREKTVNVLGAAFSKEGHADSLLGLESSRHYWFPWKRCNCKHCFLFPTFLAKFTLFIGAVEYSDCSAAEG